MLSRWFQDRKLPCWRWMFSTCSSCMRWRKKKKKENLEDPRSFLEIYDLLNRWRSDIKDIRNFNIRLLGVCNSSLFDPFWRSRNYRLAPRFVRYFMKYQIVLRNICAKGSFERNVIPKSAIHDYYVSLAGRIFIARYNDVSHWGRYFAYRATNEWKLNIRQLPSPCVLYKLETLWNVGNNSIASFCKDMGKNYPFMKTRCNHDNIARIYQT